jgi:hypothetical protein
MGTVIGRSVSRLRRSLHGTRIAVRLAVLLLLAAVALPGVFLRLAFRRHSPTLLLLVAIAPSVGILTVTTVGVALVCAGQRLSPVALLAGEAILLLPVLVLARRRGHPPFRQTLRIVWREARRRRYEYLVLALLVGTAVLAYQRPSEWVLSEGHDASNYLVQAAYHTRQASAFPGDAAPEVYAADFAHATYHLSSTVGPPGPDGLRQFPFPPLFKVLLAIAMLMGGLPWALHAPLVLGVLAALCGHQVLVRMVRRRVHALFGTALLLGSPLMLQFMRVTVSEVCLLFVSATGLALLYVAETRAGGALAGLVLSLGLLVRVDALLIWAGVIAALAVGGLAGGLKTTPAIVRAFAIAFLAGSILAWALALHTSSHYLLGHLGRVGPWVLPTLLVTAAAYGSVLACRTWPAVDRVLALRVHLAPHLTRAVAAIVAAAAAYAVIRPLWTLALWYRTRGAPLPLLSDQPGGSVFVVLGYVTVLTTVAGLAGVAWVLWKEPAGWLPWTGTFLGGALLYLDDLRHSPAPYWASRRLLCTVLPLCVAGCVFVLERWAGNGALMRRRVWAGASLVAVNLVLHNARLMLGRGIDYVGARVLDAVAAVPADRRSCWTASSRTPKDCGWACAPRHRSAGARALDGQRRGARPFLAPPGRSGQATVRAAGLGGRRGAAQPPLRGGAVRPRAPLRALAREGPGGPSRRLRLAASRGTAPLSRAVEGGRTRALTARARRKRRAVGRDPQPVDLRQQGLPRQAELDRRLRAVPAVVVERPGDVLALEERQRLAQRLQRADRRTGERKRQVLRPHGAVSRAGPSARHLALQLAHVPGPRVAADQRPDGRRHAQGM